MAARVVPETEYVKTSDGVYIAYQVVGDGPDLVLLDGWVTPLEGRWEYPAVAAALWRLASFARVISFDRRGVGLSDPAPFTADTTLDGWGEDLTAVMNAVASERAALFGSHDGGWLAMLFAAAHPERVSHLALVNTTARVVRDERTPWGIPRRAQVDDGTITEIYGKSSANNLLGLPPEHEEWWMRSRRAQASPGTFLSLMGMQSDIDLRGVLPSIRVPTLVVHRTDDYLWRVGHGRHLAASIEGAVLKEVPGTEHQWQFGDSDALVDEVEEFVTGLRPPVAADRVLATVLFLDVVSSTATLAAVGDRAWSVTLDQFEREVRTELARHRGREVFTKGDEFLATFDGPARAVRCAQATRERARKLGLEVRTGVHTGEVERRGDDVAGIAVHIGARIMSAAQGGEILVSRTVTDLVAGLRARFRRSRPARAEGRRR